ncbi:MAG: tol-pal system protein YbgF [Gallionella sp.]|nr:tol-pal system protein YbgF [Gallionella sp.]
MHRALLLLGLCLAIPANAGILEDDKARQQIKELEARVQKLQDSVQQQTRSMLDLQSQIDALNTDIRKLRGQNEETAHGLQEAEKRQKDFYVDLDTRVRHFESEEQAAKVAAASAAKSTPAHANASSPVSEDHAFARAYGLFEAGKHADAAKAFQEFLKKFPDSIHIPNATYYLGNAQYAIRNYRAALDTYEGLLKVYPDTPITPDVLFKIAECLHGLKHNASSLKVYKKIIAKYPSSKAAAKARKRLGVKK